MRVRVSPSEYKSEPQPASWCPPPRLRQVSPSRPAVRLRLLLTGPACLCRSVRSISTGCRRQSPIRARFRCPRPPNVAILSVMSMPLDLKTSRGLDVARGLASRPPGHPTGPGWLQARHPARLLALPTARVAGPAARSPGPAPSQTVAQGRGGGGHAARRARQWEVSSQGSWGRAVRLGGGAAGGKPPGGGGAPRHTRAGRRCSCGAWCGGAARVSQRRARSPAQHTCMRSRHQPCPIPASAGPRSPRAGPVSSQSPSGNRAASERVGPEREFVG